MASTRDIISHSLETLIIHGSILATLPLVYLDKELIGSRRFAWIGAAVCEFLHHYDPTLTTFSLERGSLAFISVSLVPHIFSLLKKSWYVSLAILPPLCVAFYLSLQGAIRGAVKTKEFYQVHALLHACVVILPYLHHLEDWQQQQMQKEDAQLATDGASDAATGAASNEPAGSLQKTKKSSKKNR